MVALASGAPALAAGDVRHDYRVNFAPTGRDVVVHAKLGRPGLTLTAREAVPDALQALSDCQGTPLSRPRGHRLRLPTTVNCVRYETRLAEVKRRRGDGAPELPADVVVSPVASFMWLPELAADDRVRVTANTQRQLSVPWPESRGQYFIHPSPESSTGLAVLGAFHLLDLSEVGVAKPVVFIGSGSRRGRIQRWLSTAAGAVTAVSSEFPNPQTQVLVSDVPRSGESPVPFGYVMRDQGESVHFFVDSAREPDELAYDWTAVHEFAHLLLPYVRSKWVSEGFASYYQNVLQARTGAYSELEAWRRLGRSFRSARRSGAGMSPNGTAHEDFWRARMMIYWSGAAIALHADVQLRARSGGVTSLDTVLGKLVRCCLPSSKTWEAEPLFLELDMLGGEGVFAELYRRHADSRGMPPTKALFRRLGIVGSGDQIRFDESAELAWVRRGIMSGG